MYPAIILIALVIILTLKSLYVIKEYERGVVLRFGRYIATKEPGMRAIIPFVDDLIRIDQRVVTMDVPPQDVITGDNVSLKVNAVIYFQVEEPWKAVIKIENYLLATSLFAQTTLRSVCGSTELDELLAKREELNRRIQTLVDQRTANWGIKISNVEIKDIDLAPEMRRAMAQQAEAERERRAKVIQAEGEYQAAEKLTAAAAIMSTQSAAIQLRYLDTLRSIATENNSTIVFPLPLDIFEVFKQRLGGRKE